MVGSVAWGMAALLAKKKRLPALAAALLAGLALASCVSIIAFRSDTPETDELSGQWDVGLIIHDGPAPDLIGQSSDCSLHLEQTTTALGGELVCPTLGHSTSLDGFVSPARDSIGLSAVFSDSTTEVVAELVSAKQLVGSWEDDQGFSGRFVAIRETASE